MVASRTPMTADAKRDIRARMGVVTGRIAADPAERRRRSAVLGLRLAAAIERWAGDREIAHAMAYESVATEPDLEPFASWCADRAVALYHPEVDGAALRVVPGGADPLILDVVVVPGRAFTADGRRLGRGGGHYDRFLPRLRPDCLRIAVAYHEQVLPDLPTEPHDVGLDLVVTDG